MADLILINKFVGEYSENILPITAMFEGTPTINQAGDGTVSHSSTISFEGSKSINYFCNTDTVIAQNTTFNFGDDLKSTTTKTGQHIFSFKIYNGTVLTTSFVVKVSAHLYINGLLTETYEYSLDTGTFSRSRWTTLSQSFTANAADLINFTFEMTVPPLADPNPNVSLNLDGFKLEFDDKNLGIPSIYSVPKDSFVKKSDILISETQWDVSDIGPQIVNSGSFINLFSLINNATHKNISNSDTFDQLNIVSNSIKTTYRNCKTIHLIRLTFNILTGVERFYQIQIRRTIDNSVVYRLQVQRNTDESIQTVELTTRTLSAIDPFVVDGFYIAFVNNSGSSATLDDALSVVIISTYQKLQTP